MDASRVGDKEEVGTIYAVDIREAKASLAEFSDKLFTDVIPRPFCIRQRNLDGTLTVNHGPERTGTRMDFEMFCEYLKKEEHVTGIVEAILGKCSFSVSLRAEGYGALSGAVQMEAYLKLRCAVGANNIQNEYLQQLWKAIRLCLIKYN